ncbi:hypothetical protein FB451DRAFT_1464707 [Mycena latifolia]|nr:hypothetical protein FB451DRAFT_1464707 [Mycena latifolia]
MANESKFPRIAIVDIPGKGKATYYPGKNAEKLEAALSSLSQEDLSFLLTFPCGPNEHPIRGRLKHFTPCLGDDAAGLCATICRVNHTCYSPKSGPNAAYFWNVSAKEEELRAIKEIHEGQEIEVSYMEDIANYNDPTAHLRRKFGFECSCEGCARSIIERDESKQRILAYNDFVLRLPLRFGRDNPLQILKSIEQQILIVCEEGYTGEVGARAHDAFQLCAYYGDAASARQWEAICRDCHALYHGEKSEGFEKAQRLAARPEDFRQWKGLGRKSLNGPSKQILEYCYPKVKTAQVAPNEASSSRVVPSSASASAPSTTAVQTLSKGQKKKAKAKAKKEATKGDGLGDKVLAG